MQPSSKRLLSAVVVLAIALAGYFLLRPSALSDTQQINAQLEAARAAAGKRDAAGVLQVVSGDYKDAAGLNNEQIALLLRRSLRRADGVQVSLTPPRVVVTGDTAASVSTVTVRRPGENQPAYNSPITFHWKKEDGTRFLVVPTKVWRITGADYAGGFGGEGL